MMRSTSCSPIAHSCCGEGIAERWPEGRAGSGHRSRLEAPRIVMRQTIDPARRASGCSGHAAEGRVSPTRAGSHKPSPAPQRYAAVSRQRQPAWLDGTSQSPCNYLMVEVSHQKTDDELITW